MFLDMPAVLKINPQKKVVHSTFFGVITDKEILAHSLTIQAHPDFRSEFDEIIDLTMVTDPQVTAAGLRELAARQSIFRASSKHVIIAPKDLSFEKAEEFRRMAQPSRPNLSVARTAAEAYDLLGLK